MLDTPAGRAMLEDGLAKVLSAWSEVTEAENVPNKIYHAERLEETVKEVVEQALGAAE